MGSSNGLSQPCITKGTGQDTLGTEEGSGRPYRANETLPAPLSAKRFDGPHSISNAPLALLALRHSQPHMTVLAIRVPPIHRESNIRIFEGSVSREAPVAGRRGGRGKEGISAFRAEEMLFVVGPGA